MISLERMRSIEILRGLADDELTAISHCCEEIVLEGDTVLFEEGDPANFLYTLLEGTVSLRYRLPCLRKKVDATIASIVPGGTFGWSSMRPNASYRFSAHCVGADGKAMRFRPNDLVHFLDTNPVTGYKVMKNLASVVGDRFVALQNEIAQRDGQDVMDGW